MLIRTYTLKLALTTINSHLKNHIHQLISHLWYILQIRKVNHNNLLCLFLKRITKEESTVQVFTDACCLSFLHRLSCRTRHAKCIAHLHQQSFSLRPPAVAQRDKKMYSKSKETQEIVSGLSQSDITFSASQNFNIFRLNSCHLQMFTNCFLGSWRWAKVQERHTVGLYLQ